MLDDERLRELVTRRGVRSAGIRDWFDLAEALLDRVSVQQALEGLTRPVLAVLAGASDLARGGGAPTAAAIAERIGSTAREVAEHAETAVADGLLGEESGRYAPWDAVVDQLAAWPSFGLPGLDELIWTPLPLMIVDAPRPDQPRIDAIAADRAWQLGERVVQLCLELQSEPARRLARGGIALPETRRLAAAAGIEQEELGELVRLAAAAGLVEESATRLRTSEAAAVWTALPASERWLRLATVWFEDLATPARQLLSERPLSGEALNAHLEWLFPAGGEAVRERIESARATAELLGVSVDGAQSTLGRALFTDPAEAAVFLRERTPAEVDRVYLQHDLTVIAPGPLETAVEAALRRIAEPEARGLAPTFRFTQQSLTRAFIAGEDAASIRATLARISLTGVPQPLDYLIEQTAARFGSVRVSAPATPTVGGRALVTTDEAELLDRILVDSALTALGLRRVDATTASSPVEAGTLFWALVDARYPAVSVDAHGRPSAPSRWHLDAEPAAERQRDPAAELIARLRGAAGSSAPDGELGDGAWIARQLELAARARVPVVVSVRMPSGQLAEFRLEPASIVGGRLRGRDAASDIERTLPLSSIVTVTTLD